MFLNLEQSNLLNRTCTLACDLPSLTTHYPVPFKRGSEASYASCERVISRDLAPSGLAMAFLIWARNLTKKGNVP